jgi:hypothetical protein
MILIQSPDGSEKCLVKSLDGYPGWTVLADPAEPPGPFHYWDEEADEWRLDEEAQARGELLALVSNPETLADLIADILARLPAPE